jgi:hypothetical protein
MHPALWKLMRLLNRASLRRLVRGARTLRGALVLLFLLAILGFGLGSIIVMTFVMRNVPETSRLSGSAGPYVPLLLLVLFLQSVLGRNSGAALLHFIPPEVEFLFAGPFHRRQLLVYKLWRWGIGLVVGALFLSLTPIAVFFHGWLSLFVGLILSLTFISLSSLAVGLLRQIVAETAHTRVRKAVLIAVTILAAVALPRTVSQARVLHAADLASSFRSTGPGRVLVAPFEVFTNAMLAERWFPDLLGWAGAAAAIDLALLILVLRLDADYIEWSAEFSQRIYEIQERARKTGGLIVTPSRTGSRFPLSRFPWWGGAGPVARVQLIQMSRKYRGAVAAALIITVAISLWNGLASARFPTAAISPSFVLMMFWYGTGMTCMAAPVAFRGDLDQMDLLKALPMRPLAVAVGELAGCVAGLTAFQLAFLGIYAIVAQAGGWPLLAAAILLPASNWLLLATSNLTFLMYPVPMGAAASTDLNVAGRGCLGLFLQMLMILPLFGIPAGLAGLAYLASGLSRPAPVAMAFVALWVEVVPMTLLVARAFERFDPSLDVPA